MLQLSKQPTKDETDTTKARLW